MPLPNSIADLTHAKWKAAKADAGVRGAGFFDGKAGKGVGAKIDDYQAAVKALEADRTVKTCKAMVDADRALATALTIAKKDRGPVAEGLKTSIDKWLHQLTTQEIEGIRKLHEMEGEKPVPGDDKKAKLRIELDKCKTYNDVMAHPVLKSFFVKYAVMQALTENLRFLDAVKKNTPRDEMERRFVDEKSPENVSLTDRSREAFRNGDMEPAIAQVTETLRDSLMSFKREMESKLK